MGWQRQGKKLGHQAVYQPFNGNDSAPIGPFNPLGIYHLYCTIHQSMNLKVIVTV